jgi:hypothetical protein
VKNLTPAAAVCAASMLLAFGLASAPAAAADPAPILGGAELPLVVTHLAVAAPAAGPVQDQPPPTEPEPRPEPFPAPPEQPPAQRPPDQPPSTQPPSTQPPMDEEPPVDIELEPPAADVPAPDVLRDEGEAATEPDAEPEAVWYRSPLWIVLALVFVVVIVILIFSGRRR